MPSGTISVQTENIFPIIKKFLYSDQEIFLRELIANAVDATSKIKTLSSRGEFKGELGATNIDIILDAEAKTLTIRDRGIGMTEEEVNKYLNQVAFSSAAEFLEKYKDDTNIIGHFGLGFYSAFMVADKVEVITKSWQDTPAVSWTCDGQPEYTIDSAERDFRGTDIILHISEEADEYLLKDRIQKLLDKYCKFLPVEIVFGTRTETHYEGEGDDQKAVSTEVPNQVNNTNPLWKKSPSELKDEDYINFYQELYPYSEAPLFWIHLNIDYPFNLTGVLYFPRLKQNIEVQKNKIHLYSNQVFVTDEVKEIVPEFLMLLHGVIDSPDIPLNVSRSYLQGDRNVKKISEYITKKVADKLDEMFRKEREKYEEKWESINVFVKYGMLTDEKFNEKARKFCLLENVDNKLFTFEEYRAKIAETQTDKAGKLVHLYTNNLIAHDSYVKAAQDRGYDVLLFDQIIDAHFMQKAEVDHDKIAFARVDADTMDRLIQKDEKPESVLNEDETKTLEQLFKDKVGDSLARVELVPMSPNDQPVVITKPEWMRRMKEMQALGGGMDFPDSYNVVVNTNHPIFSGKLFKLEDDAQKGELTKHLYDLARLHQNMLQGAELTDFIRKNLDLLSK